MSKTSCDINDDDYMQNLDALTPQGCFDAEGGSGWIVKTLSLLEIKAVCYYDVTGGSYIETLAVLKPLKRSFLSVANKRDKFVFFVSYQKQFCFLPLASVFVRTATKETS